MEEKESAQRTQYQSLLLLQWIVNTHLLLQI